MSALDTLQRDFMAAIFSEDADTSSGLAIYRRNARANLAGALAATFPVVRRLVGEAFFDAAGLRFAIEQPSRSGDLAEYGAVFPAFLADYAHARSLAYLPDVARLEWACHESEHAAEARPIDIAPLALVPERNRGAIRFRLHPAVRLVHSPYPVCAIWQANQAARDGTPDRTEGEEFVLVSRAELEVRATCVERFEWEFLARVRDGATLEEASAAMGADDLARFLAPALARYTREAIFAGFDAPEGSA